MKDIRVGILTNGMSAPAWVQDMLRMSVAQEGVKISLVVDYSIDGANVRHVDSARTPLLDAWLAVDKRLIKVSPDAFEAVDMSAVLADAPVLNVRVDAQSNAERFAQHDIAQIKTHDIDVFLLLGALRPGDDILNAASSGIWYFEHGDGQRSQQTTVGMHDILTDSTHTESALQWRVAGSNQAHTLQRSWSVTHPFSIHRNRSYCYWKTLSFFPRKLQELRSIGAASFRQRYAADRSRTTPMPVRRHDNAVSRNALHMRQIAGLVARIAASKVANLTTQEQWMLLYRFSDEATPTNPHTFTELVPPRDRFWADPFVIRRNGEYVVFIEELEYADNRGYISAIRFDANHQPILPPIKVIQRPYHMSYPYLIEHEGELYMIPETHQSRAIELYRCVQFPDKWEYVMNLMEDVMAVDTTIWRHEGKFWMFVGMRDNEHASLSEELFLFSADTLLTQNWKPHPRNPIVSDVRCARPAGNIFEHKGAWYRPAQDCSGKYGRALTVQRIDVIDDETYQETPVSRIDANWTPSIDRVHTFNRDGQLSLIDGMKIHRKFRTPA